MKNASYFKKDFFANFEYTWWRLTENAGSDNRQNSHVTSDNDMVSVIYFVKMYQKSVLNQAKALKDFEYRTKMAALQPSMLRILEESKGQICREKRTEWWRATYRAEVLE